MKFPVNKLTGGINPRFVDLRGLRYGRLVPCDYLGGSKWLCQCDCGNTTVRDTRTLRYGPLISCGCAKMERITALKASHRLSCLPEYKVWKGMISRCEYSTATGYKNYGGRGISVCDRWRHSFGTFLHDVGLRPTSKHSIDRIDTNGNYEPDNVRWATRHEQALNRRKTTP